MAEDNIVTSFADANGNDDPFLSGLMHDFISKNQSWVDSARDDEQRAKREQKLNDRMSKIMEAYNTYGKEAFTPKQKPSELNVPWAQDNYAGQVEDSPSYTPPKSQYEYGDPVDAFSEGAAQGLPSDTEGERAKLRDFGTAIYKNYTPGGLVAPVVSGGLNLVQKGAEALGLTSKAGEGFGDYVADQVTPEEKTPEGKKFEEAISTPWRLLGEAGRKAGEVVQDNPGVASVVGMGSIYGPLGAAAGQTETGRRLLATGVETAPMAAMLFAGAGKEKPKKITGDPDIDAGIDAGMKIAPDSVQPDLFSPQPELGLDMFSKESVPADVIEARRQQAELANKGELPQRSSEQDARLEQDYLLDMNDKKRAEFEAARKANAANPPAQADMWNFGAVPDTAMGNALKEAGLRRGVDAQGQNTFPDIREQNVGGAGEWNNQEPFQPSRNASVDQNQVQGRLELPAQQDLFGNRSETAAKTPIAEDVEEAPKSKDDLLKSLRNKLQAPVASIGNDPSAYHRLPSSVLDAHDGGKLNTGHVFDAVADNHEGLFDNDPAQQGLADELRKKGEQLGGLDVPIEQVHEDPANHTSKQAEVVARYNKIAEAEGQPLFHDIKGVYDPTTKAIYINGPQGMDLNTLAHESAHAVAHAAIDAGEQGKLTGDRLKGFNTLQAVFDQVKGAADPKSSKAYGFRNLQEMVAELHSNPHFREVLKSIPLDTIAQGKMGLGRMTVGVVKNMYQAAVRGLSKMIGLSSKADTAYDALVSQTHNFLGSFDKAPEEAGLRPAAKQKEEYKPPVTDPLSRTQKVAGDIKFFGRRLAGLSTAPELATRRAREEATGFSNNARMDATRSADDLRKAIKNEGVSAGDVTHYMKGEDPKALNRAPETKKIIDEQFAKPSRENARNLAQLIADNPSARKVDLEFAHEVLDNPAYTMRAYQPLSFTAGVIRNSRAADAAGNSATIAQRAAKKIVDDTKDWIKRTLIPNPAVTHNLSGLRTMAKALGIDAPKLLDGVVKDQKKAVLAKAIKDAVPDADAVDKATERLLYEVAGLVNTGSSPVARYYRGARLGDILTTRKSVPPELKALWGEVQDPANVMIQTLVKQANGIAHLTQQKAIREAGVDGGWLHDNKLTAPAGYTEKLTGRKMGYLQNMYTSPEIKQMLNSQVELSTAGNSVRQALMSGNPDAAVKHWLGQKALNVWTTGVGNFKAFRLASDPGYYIMYMAGGPSILATHGIVDPRYALRGAVAHLAEISPSFLRNLPSKLQAQAKADLQHIVKAGMNEATSAGEIFDAIQAKKLVEAIQSGQHYSGLQAVGSALMHAAGSLKNAGITALSLTDGYAKRAAILHRMDVLGDFYNRQGTPKSIDAIRAEAADWVKDTTITNSRTPVLARLSEKLGASQGLIYGVETLRNVKNAVMHGAADVARGMKSNDSIMVAHGLKQLSGTGLAIGYMGTLISSVAGTILATQGIASNAIPATDERQKMLQQKGSRFEGQRPEEINDPADPNNKYLWSPGDRNDFFYQASQPVHVVMDALERQKAGQNVDPVETAKSAVSAFTGTFFRNGLTNKMLNLVQGKEPGWERDAPEFSDKAKQFYNDLGVDDPTAINRMLSLEDIFRPGFMRNFDMASEQQASSGVKALTELGLGVVKVPNDAGLSTNTSKRLNKESDDARKALDETLMSTANFSKDTLDRNYKKAFLENYQVLKKAQDDIAYAKAQGLDGGKVLMAAATGKMQKDIMMEAFSGRLNPAQSLYKNLIPTIVDEMKREQQTNPDRADRLKAQYLERAQQLAKLTVEYSKLTPEQIEALK
jgi:hypothetical protein